MAQEITIPVRLDEKTFRRFSRFDALRLRKRWVRPVGFALILAAFAAVALLSRKPQAAMLAAVLLVVGLGLPLVYFGTFFSQVNLQCVRRGLDKKPAVYTVFLRREGVRVVSDQKAGESVEVPWKDFQAAFRDKGCVYLYANAARAYLLPDGQASAPPEAVWQMIEAHMKGKCRVL